MRRVDRKMNQDFGRNIIDHSDYGVLSINDENAPYSLPLSIVRDGNRLYFHSAKQGRKVELLEDGLGVGVVFVGRVNVPDNFTKEELEEMAKDKSKAIKFISSVFTTEFESAIVTGKVHRIEDRDERVKAMRLICEKYTPSKMDYFDIAIGAGLDKTNVYVIDIEEITAKRKKYDLDREEMKWERME